jgi:hypothetical protein
MKMQSSNRTTGARKPKEVALLYERLFKLVMMYGRTIPAADVEEIAQDLLVAWNGRISDPPSPCDPALMYAAVRGDVLNYWKKQQRRREVPLPDDFGGILHRWGGAEPPPNAEELLIQHEEEMAQRQWVRNRIDRGCRGAMPARYHWILVRTVYDGARIEDLVPEEETYGLDQGLAAGREAARTRLDDLLRRAKQWLRWQYSLHSRVNVR